jgi:DNA-binding phage protein
MALTRDFRETIIERAKKDPAYRRGMLTRGIAYLLMAGNEEDLHVGKSLIRDYINATVGFTALARRTHIPKESLMRMFSPKGNPSLNNLNAVIHTLLAKEGVKTANRLKIALG